MRIDQLLPGFTSGDAVSSDACEIQSILRQQGCESDIFTESRHTSPKVRHLCRDYSEYTKYSSKENVIIYHHSIGSGLSRYFQGLRSRRILIYHNITPEKYFRSINTEKALALYEGRKQLLELADAPFLSLADSEYNRMELEKAGYRNTEVLPIIMNFDMLGRPPKKSILRRYRDNFVNMLFVGRITPNKKVEDVIKVFYYFKKTVNINSRLFIAGSFTGMEKYCDFLHGMVLELGLSDVVFTGHIPLPELLAYYRTADLFLCMSEHEGFCVPLLESMYFGVPIIAYNAAAVPYTLGGCGVLIEDKDYAGAAELAGIISEDSTLRNSIASAQKKRLNDFSRKKTAGILLDILSRANCLP